MRKQVLLEGLVGGHLIVALRWVEYRFLIVDHSLAIHGGIVAALFAGVGIWLGLRLTGRQETVVVREVMVPAPATFERDQGHNARLLSPATSRRRPGAGRARPHGMNNMAGVPWSDSEGIGTNSD